MRPSEYSSVAACCMQVSSSSAMPTHPVAKGLHSETTVVMLVGFVSASMPNRKH